MPQGTGEKSTWLSADIRYLTWCEFYLSNMWMQLSSWVVLSCSTLSAAFFSRAVKCPGIAMAICQVSKRLKNTFLWLMVPSFIANSKWPKALTFVLNQNLIVCQIAFVTIYDSLKIKLNFISRSKSITHKILPEFVSVLKSDPTPSTGSGGPFRLSLQCLSHWCLLSTPAMILTGGLTEEKFLNMWLS